MIIQIGNQVLILCI